MYPKEKKDEVASQTEDVADAPDAEETINDATTDKDTETKQETPEATAPEFCETKKESIGEERRSGGWRSDARRCCYGSV